MYDIIMVDQNEFGFEGRWDALRQRFPFAKRIQAEPGTIETIQKAANAAKTKYFYMVPGDLLISGDFDFEFEVPPQEPEMSYFWGALDADTIETICLYRGVRLLATKTFRKPAESSPGRFDFKSYDAILEIKKTTPLVKQMDDFSGYCYSRCDVVFVSYDEPDADLSYERFLTKCPHAKRVHGIKGIRAAHKEAARISSTNYLYVVDADCEVHDGFDFSWTPPPLDPPMTTLWYARNAVNGLEYGYGGIKMFYRAHLLGDPYRAGRVDLTTSISEHLRVIPEVVSTTRFNRDEFTAFRAGFREAAKLQWQIKAGNISPAKERLTAWESSGLEAPYGYWTIRGATLGWAHAILNEEHDGINDFEYLRSLYERTVANEPS